MQMFNAETRLAKERELNKYFTHSTEYELDEYRASAMPQNVKDSLVDIMESPLGDKIRNGVDSTGSKIELTQSLYEESAFQASGNQVYYGDVDTFNARGITMHQTMGTLLAHEIGHTQSYMANYSFVPSPGTNSNENWTVTNAEDIYRAYKGLPLRRNYDN
ncbi:hypothetical protein C3B51_22750 [Pseudoalteromonas rubra]|uniref:Uncharacterized protein n=1 Tax=Pseudoalteromonas rubra TaxID=43658 RepID=A0A4Q7DZA7_9GAMM|nr:hypothetical protein [Pseudoalteromonas rubra]RZM71256.1 hypothetical protein C3B51_22750 [Pseudoalteromonas rubra]